VFGLLELYHVTIACDVADMQVVVPEMATTKVTSVDIIAYGYRNIVEGNIMLILVIHS